MPPDSRTRASRVVRRFRVWTRVETRAVPGSTTRGMGDRGTSGISPMPLPIGGNTPPKATGGRHGHDHDHRRHGDLLQGLGHGQPIVFSHGWPLSADDWDTQMLFFLQHGYRVIAHDRRGHGRSTQTGDGHDMDHYADDLAALTAHLDLQNAVHVGHSTGGGEVVHYLARHGESRVAKAVLISAVPPLMVKTDGEPGRPSQGSVRRLAGPASGQSLGVLSRRCAAGPFYGFNRPGAKSSEAIIQNWWRQGMMGGAKAHYDGIVAFSQTDFTEDLKKISVPVLVMHGDDDQIVPYADSGPLVGEACSRTGR